MSALLRRLGRGERSWVAEFGLRLSGLGLLGLCALAAWWLCQAARQGAGHASYVAEFAAAAVVVLGWALGWALLAEGPGLFRLMPVPPRPIYNRVR